MKFYAVKVGRQTGVFYSWSECEAQVKGYPGAQYKSFKTEKEALEYLGEYTTPTIPSMSQEYSVYTDGGYKNGRYAWGYAIVKNDEIIHQACGLGTNQEAAKLNNVAGELSAVMRAVKYLHENNLLSETVAIYHDYEGVAKWVTGEWKCKNEFTKAYKNYMEKYKPYIKFVHVKGHSGNTFNEYVDQLCSSALKEVC